MLRTVIVDDEDLARRGIRALLATVSDVEIIAECSNAREAIDVIRAQAPDLVFLDVQMPGKSGFDVIDAIGPGDPPHIVFVTAFDEFAVRAFEVNALDYILKPVCEDRFALALQRARNALASARDGSVGRRLAQLAADLGQPDQSASTYAPDRIPVKTGGRVMIIRIADVDWVKAEQDYVSLYIGSKSWLVREAISSIEARFANCGFVRIHRSGAASAQQRRIPGDPAQRRGA
jgi:two-component system, LytTR family, response regulator